MRCVHGVGIIVLLGMPIMMAAAGGGSVSEAAVNEDAFAYVHFVGCPLECVCFPFIGCEEAWQDNRNVSTSVRHLESSISEPIPA
jgi:hypothetical protein